VQQNTDCSSHLSSTFINQEQVIRVMAGLLVVCWQGNGGAGGGLDVIPEEMSFDTSASGCACDKMFFASFSLML